MISFHKLLNIKHIYIGVIKNTHTWVQPNGHDTGVKVYNCITKQKEKLVLRHENFLTWYTCGPTVYDSSHVGHASSFVKLDIIQNILRDFLNYNLITVMNITDIDDKIIKKAASSKSSVQSIIEKYEKEFWQDLIDLKISKPNIVLRVTENINIIIDFIKDLENRGKAYKASDNSVYFDVKQLEKLYGKLQNLGEEANRKSKSSIKKNAIDFALWKSATENEPFWESPWGPGRPGWHTECSALASSVFGSRIDIHAGGIDLRFPHHENEEIQCCAYHQTNQWVNYWLHTGHLHLKDSEKMSKSFGKTISIQDMLKTITPEVFKMACAMTHYRSPVEYSQELLITAENRLKGYNNFIDTVQNCVNGVLICSDIDTVKLNEVFVHLVSDVESALCDDFDTPKVVKVLDESINKVNILINSSISNAQNNKTHLPVLIGISNFVSKILNLFGVQKLQDMSDKDVNYLAEVMDILIDFRKNVRVQALQNKDKDILSVCDDVRDKLAKSGIVLKDYKDKSAWSKS